MSKEKPKINITQQLLALLDRLKKYSFVLFTVLVVGLYGFIIFKISSLHNAQPSTDSVTAQVKAAKIPHIDESVINQLKSLHDNSVSVQTLFESSRNNPFKE